MADTEITSWLDSHKYNALKVALATEGKTVEAECQALLDILYEQTVDADERLSIDETIVKEFYESEQGQRLQRELEQKISVFKVRENGQATYYRSDIYLSHYDILRRCALGIRDKAAEHERDITASAFPVRERICHAAFVYHCEFPTGPPRLVAAAEIDFDAGRYAIYKDGEWPEYSLKELVRMTDHIARLKDRMKGSRNPDEIFMKKLEAVEPIQTEQAEGSTQNNQEQDSAQGITFCK